MALIILNHPYRYRFSWPFMVSAGLHALLLVGLLYATVSPVHKPTGIDQPMAVMLVAPEPQPAALKLKVVSESVQESLTTMQVLKPVLKPKPKSKPKLEWHQEIRPQPSRTEIFPIIPTSREQLTHPDTTLVRRAPANTSVNNISDAPRVTNRINPIYPSRAQALGIEGRVSVMFDVNADGRVENVRILSAHPRNMFERDIRLAMRHWTYELGRPATNLTVNFKFDLKKVSNS